MDLCYEHHSAVLIKLKKINSQSLEDTQVGYILQKYTLDKYTLEKYTLEKLTFSLFTLRKYKPYEKVQKCKINGLSFYLYLSDRY